MNFTRTDIINSTFINGHYLTIFELDYNTITTNHPRYIFQDAVYTHRAVLDPNSNTLKYYPEYMPIYNSRAYNENEYNDCLHEFQAFCNMYQNTPDDTTSIMSKADFGTDVYNTYLCKSYDKLTFNPSTSSLTVGSSNNPTSSMWIDGMTKAAVNTYSNGYRAWISGSTDSGRLSIGSFGNGDSYDGKIYFSYAAEKDIIAGTNTVNSRIWINPKTSIIRSDYYSGNSYTATGGYHLL